MEVFLIKSRGIYCNLCFLHASGGVSNFRVLLLFLRMFSPRQWRCFSIAIFKNLKLNVFSTPVEVFLKKTGKNDYAKCFLHASGGVSVLVICITFFLLFSPRQWRCFEALKNLLFIPQVFSTPVEVFLKIAYTKEGKKGFLHASGGVSCGSGSLRNNGEFSPRQWRCFLLCSGLLA